MNNKLKILGFSRHQNKDINGDFNTIELLKSISTAISSNRLNRKKINLVYFNSFVAVPFFTEFNDDNIVTKINELNDKLKKADAVLIISPESNIQDPKSLLITINWARRQTQNIKFENKPIAIIRVYPQNRVIDILTNINNVASNELRKYCEFMNLFLLDNPEMNISL